MYIKNQNKVQLLIYVKINRTKYKLSEIMKDDVTVVPVLPSETTSPTLNSSRNWLLNWPPTTSGSSKNN